jgi:hypothetical protein
MKPNMIMPADFLLPLASANGAEDRTEPALAGQMNDNNSHKKTRLKGTGFFLYMIGLLIQPIRCDQVKFRYLNIKQRVVHQTGHGIFALHIAHVCF